MTKYQVVYSQNGGWCVIVTSKAREEDRFYGFRDEDHARDWIVKKREKKQLTGKSGALVM